MSLPLSGSDVTSAGGSRTTPAARETWAEMSVDTDSRAPQNLCLG